MQLHELKPLHKLRKKKRIGRGGKRGTYSGKGLKGQKARAGAKIRPMERELIMRLPKQRGVKFKSRAPKPAVVSAGMLEKKFSVGETVSPEKLLERGLIEKVRGRLPEVKLLGGGKLTKALLVSDCQISESAKKQIEEAGGSVKEVESKK